MRVPRLGRSPWDRPLTDEEEVQRYFDEAVRVERLPGPLTDEEREVLRALDEAAERGRRRSRPSSAARSRPTSSPICCAKSRTAEPPMSAMSKAPIGAAGSSRSSVASCRSPVSPSSTRPPAVTSGSPLTSTDRWRFSPASRRHSGRASARSRKARSRPISSPS